MHLSVFAPLFDRFPLSLVLYGGKSAYAMGFQHAAAVVHSKQMP